MPQYGARTNALAFVPAVEHRPAGQHDGRQVGGGRCHQAGRGGFVATGGQHYAVQRVTMQHLDQAQVGEVAVEGRGGAARLLGNRVYRKLHRDATCIANAVLDPLGQFDVMAVAGRQVAAGLGDADNRPPRLQFGAGQALVHVAFHIQCGQVGVAWVVEPQLAAQAAWG